MKDLSSLELDFKDTQVGDESLKALCEVFSKNTTLVNLRLDFYNTTISDESLCLMLNEVIPKLPALKNFYINIKKVHMNQATNALVDQINKKYQ